MASLDPSSETERSKLNAIEEVFDLYHDSGDELNTDTVSEEEDGKFYDGYLDQKNWSRSLTPSPSVQDDEFREERVNAPAFSPAQLDDQLHSIQLESKKRSRSSTLTLKNMYGREPGDSSDSDRTESDDEEVQSQGTGSSDWEL